MKLTTTYAIAIAGLVVAAGIVGAAGPALGAEDANTIDACRTISEPGVYELQTNLTDDVDSPDACIDVESDDVAIDGNGHRITMAEPEGYLDDGSPTPYAVQADGVENVTVTTLTADDWGFRGNAGAAGLLFENASDVTVTDITAVSSRDGIVVKNSSDVTVRDVDLNGGGISPMYQQSGSGVLLSNVDNAAVRGGVVEEWNIGIAVEESANVAIADLIVGKPGDTGSPDTRTGVDVRTTDNATIRNSTISSAKRTGISLARGVSDVVVADNRISRHPGAAIDVAVFDADGGANVIRNNTITKSEDGIEVRSTTSELRIEGNRLTDNGDGVGVESPNVCKPSRADSEFVVVHENVIENNDVGIRNEGGDAVNATRNYWGAADGPSSVADSDAPFGETDPEVPLEDPVTGTLADGSGDSVSEFPDENESGIANVRFDPWLEMPPTGTTNETA
ncbi:right-handed parallel beta-helix repeat-containing protein [Halorussus salinisoli]|uniref:right-handed parallel beta-helix repeat-containing protein n=1 Tax=Halorussus salinisoli TaxID=2558242 RepID=UPI0010C1E677|nr:right-handed parallel beta-helix repeat-containing protein [Halorussus salinisoli]